MRVIVYLKRILYGLVLLGSVVIVIGPWGLYWLGLHAVNGVPVPPTSVATEAEINEIWLKFEGKGQPEVVAISPHDYIYQLYKENINNTGLRLSWQVASSYLISNKKYKGNGWWHLSGAALTIWVSRNWSSEQICTRVLEIEGSKEG
jgi:hypothetical protein